MPKDTLVGKVRAEMADRGITTVNDLAEALELSPPVARDVLAGKLSFSLHTMDQLKNFCPFVSDKDFRKYARANRAEVLTPEQLKVKARIPILEDRFRNVNDYFGISG